MEESFYQPQRPLNPSSSECVTDHPQKHLFSSKDYFQRFLEEKENQQKIDLWVKYRQEKSKKKHQEIYQSKRSILPSKTKHSSQTSKMIAKASLHLEFNKIDQQSPNSFIQIKPNLTDIESTSSS